MLPSWSQVGIRIYDLWQFQSMLCDNMPITRHLSSMSSPLSQEADEVLANAEGRWMSFCATNMTLVLLERKGLPEHLASMDSLETVVTLQSLICDLQDLGEVSRLTWTPEVGPTLGLLSHAGKTIHFWLAKVKLELSHHKMEDTDWVNNKSLVFVLDQPPQPQDPQKKKGKKIKGTVQISAKNFGSWMSVTKLKTAGDTVNIAWRVRFPVFEKYCQNWYRMYASQTWCQKNVFVFFAASGWMPATPTGSRSLLRFDLFWFWHTNMTWMRRRCAWCRFINKFGWPALSGFRCFSV